MTYHQIPMHTSDDDIFVHSRYVEFFYSTFSIRPIKETNLTLKAKKCNFFIKEVIFIGHVFSKEGIKTDLPPKITQRKELKVLRNVSELRSFL